MIIIDCEQGSGARGQRHRQGFRENRQQQAQFPYDRLSALGLVQGDRGIGERYQVKQITVKPGARLSLQVHHHRAEHWIVVRGTARVTRGDEDFLLCENESTYIPQKTKHRLENPGKIPLIIIEVQSGSYLGEDDIIRLEDTYGRVETED